MALWSNTADGWGSDPSKSGNGALAAYLQSSAASSPKLQSATQAQDPGNSMPTSSISRTVQPARTNTLVQSVTAQPVVQAAPVAQAAPVTQTPSFGVSRVSQQAATDTSVPYTVGPSAPSTAAQAAVPAYGGPAVARGVDWDPQNGYTQYYSVFDPSLGKYVDAGSYNAQTNVFTNQYGQKLTGADATAANQTIRAKAGDVSSWDADYETNGDQLVARYIGKNATAAANAKNADALKQYQTVSLPALKANQQAQSAENNKNYYLQYLLANGGKLPHQTQGVDPAVTAMDNESRNAALAEYQANQASAAVLGRGIAPVDTSTQDAINTASLNALSSRFGTNNYGNNVAAMGRLFAQAVVDQGGVNKQLSDEDYAIRYNQNQAQFAAAVQNQANLDSNATGAKLQSDIQAVSDVVDKLNQQVSQLNTQSAQAVQAKLLELQKQINEYNEAVRDYTNDTDFVKGLAKTILGGAAALTSIALAPVTGGASVAAGVAAGAAIAKA